MNRKKITSVLLIAALVLTPLLMASFLSVEAAKLTDVSDVLSDSGISADADHEIAFTATSGVSAAQTITLTFDSAASLFDLSTIGFADIDLLAGSCGSETSRGLAATASGATWGVTVSTPSDVITFTSDTDTIGAGNCVIVRIGENATGGASNNQITNPSSAGVRDIDVVTTSDDGLAKVAIVSHVDVDVTVDETLTFTVTGQASGGGACETTTTTLSTPTAVSFGSVTANTFYNACQELTVSTNASAGYSVTVQQTDDLTSAALDEIAKENCDGSCAVGSEGAWATASNNGFAYCVEDVTGAGTDAVTTNDCAAGTPGYRLFGDLGTDTPEVIMSNAGVVSANAIELAMKISVSGSQPSGTYSNEILYVATPTY